MCTVTVKVKIVSEQKITSLVLMLIKYEVIN
jgi:hypothetical protein